MKFTFEGSSIKAEYKEPVQNELNDDGVNTPLEDLAKTSIKFQVVGGDVVVAKEVPATALTGGGDVVESFVIPALEKKQATVDLWLTATDLVGNESVPSEKTTLSVDRLAPLPPQ